MKKSFKLKPIHLKGKNISLKASNNISILKNKKQFGRKKE